METMPSNTPLQPSNTPPRVVIQFVPWLIAVGVFAIWFVLGVVVPWWMYDTQACRGTFGDQFGAANSALTGLTLLALALSILLQRRELALVVAQHRSSEQRDQLQLAAPHLQHFVAAKASGEYQNAIQFGAGIQRKVYAAKSKEEATQCVYAFREHTNAEMHRAAFMRPMFELWAIRNVGVVTDEHVRKVLTEGDAELALDVYLPLGMALHGRIQTDVYDWLASLYRTAGVGGTGAGS